MKKEIVFETSKQLCVAAFPILEAIRTQDIEIQLPQHEGIPARIPEKDEVFPPDIAKEYFNACGAETNADDWIEAAEILQILKQCGFGTEVRNMQALECGTGPGKLAELLSHNVAHMTATDASPTMIALAKEKHKKARETGKLSFELAEARNLPFPDEEFNLVVAKHLLHQLPTGAAFQFLTEVVRVLKPDGMAIIGDYNRLSSRGARDIRLKDTLPEMQPLLEESFDASFTPGELAFMLHEIPGIEFAIVLAEDPSRLSESLRKIIQDDPVKGHAVDWLTRLRIVIHKQK
jgi:ubiquinone/menaquinone biosynthesis C-methylase UbiE